MTELPESLLNRLKLCRTLPTMPAVALQVLDLCEHSNVSLSMVARVVARDPVLAAKVLKVANSPLYGLRTAVTTLNRAISILGTNATLSLSLSFSLVGTMRKSKDIGFDHSTYWRRAIITAAAAKELGAWKSLDTRDELFIVGLLQDIGMLVLNDIAPDIYGKLYSAAGRSHKKLVELERETIGADHAEVGNWLLKRWNLPDDLRLPVAASHSPEFAAESRIAEFSRAIAFASQVAEIWTNPQTGDAVADAQQCAHDFFQMPSERFERLLRDVAARLPEITSNLELDIGGEEMIGRLLDQAREALVLLNLHAQQQFRLMQDKATRDGLISVFNRRHLEEVLPGYFDAARRGNQPLSAVFADIDHFKEINDTYGHQAGDLMLKSVAASFRSILRLSDLVARYGGDEFVCLLPNTSESDAMQVAERIRQSIADAPHTLSTRLRISLTLSMGCATFSLTHPFPDGLSLLKEADRRLYIAKRSGRNRVVGSKTDSTVWEASASGLAGSREAAS